MTRLKVGVLGATGMVGQIYLRILADHPWFRVSAVSGNTTVGKKLIDAYGGKGEVPAKLRDLEVLPSDPSVFDADLIFSCLPTEAARKTEPEFAKAGFPVVSDASAHRYQDDVPLLVPEVNPEHLDLIDVQRGRRGWDGFIVTTPNCTTLTFVLPMKPLLDSYGVSYVDVVTMQSVSGAGYSGVPSMAILGNVIPYIRGEEEKVSAEPRKIMGRLSNGRVEPAAFEVDATCTRVPTLVGHLASVNVELNKRFDLEEVKDSLESFRGLPQRLELPTAPRQPVVVMDEPDRPQPRFDAEAGDVKGMPVFVGRLRRGSRERTLRFVSLSNNLVRGAAGIAILTAELLHATGRV
ncbi:MAG: aspartate-semialdehyde dehydrogenase [Aigarchaeota archaeon]|nr:aspartate-semialdehyde dehydrogenase [Aigarchaeota archaeon]MDW8041362.1 aspartate-semialdehyde dehydrogenase [Nitrososphaerota archaeon]